MNKIAVIANKRFEPGLIAFINSYKVLGVDNRKFPLVIIDTGLENQYPYETIKKDVSHIKLGKQPWMVDNSPYMQLELDCIEADKILFLEVDMLLLKDEFEFLFDQINRDNKAISVMDDAALASFTPFHIDSAGRFFKEGSELRHIFRKDKGYNTAILGANHKFFEDLHIMYPYYVDCFEKQYRLGGQSLINQFFILEDILVQDMGTAFNYSGINEYYDRPELYEIKFENNKYSLKFNGENVYIPHFTSKDKPWFNDTPNIMRPVWEYYYNKGELF